MLQIRYQNQKLHLPIGTKIRIKKVNPFFAKSVVPAVFSYPFELPSNPQNDKLLSWLKEPTSLKTGRKQIDVTVRLGGVDFDGKLIIHRAEKTYYVSLLIDGSFINQEAKKLLSEFNWPEEEIFEFKDYWYGYVSATNPRSGKVQLEIVNDGVTLNYEAQYKHSFKFTLEQLALAINNDNAANDCFAYTDDRHIIVVYQHTDPMALVFFTENTTGTMAWAKAYYHESANRHGTGTENRTDLETHMNRVADQVCFPRMFTYYTTSNPGVYPTDYSTSPFQNESIFYFTEIVDSSLPGSARRFGLNADLYGTTPFIYVKKLLLKLAAILGYALDDSLFDTELETLTLYNDKVRGITRYSGVSSDDYVVLPTGEQIDIAKHMPKATLAELLKSISQLFCVGIFINEITQTIVLKPMKTILQSNTRKDISNRIKRLKTEIIPQGYSLNFKTPTDNAASQYFNYDNNLVITGTVDDYASLPTTGLAEDDIYFVVEDNNIYKAIRENGASSFRWQLLGAKIYAMANDADEVNELLSIEVDGAPLPLINETEPTESYPLPYANTSSPKIIVTDKTNTIGLRYLFYRGRIAANAQVTVDSGPEDFEFYCGTPLATDPQGNSIGNYELLWHGEKGLYNVWWKPFLDRFANARLFEFQSFLALEEIIAYDFTELIHANGKDYLVKEFDYEIEIGKTTVLQTFEAYEV